MADERRRNITVFGQETEFDGTLEFTDNLVITGKFRGTIDSTGNLEIARGASCDVGHITANAIEISGSVHGNLEAAERVELCSGCTVHGDIRTGRLRMADDVEYEGQVSMIESVPDVNLFSVVSSEYKQALLLKTSDPR